MNIATSELRLKVEVVLDSTGRLLEKKMMMMKRSCDILLPRARILGSYEYIKCASECLLLVVSVVVSIPNQPHQPSLLIGTQIFSRHSDLLLM